MSWLPAQVSQTLDQAKANAEATARAQLQALEAKARAETQAIADAAQRRATAVVVAGAGAAAAELAPIAEQFVPAAAEAMAAAVDWDKVLFVGGVVVAVTVIGSVAVIAMVRRA
jgi:hypothetical protein